jgi:hypothetical protein
MKKEENRDEMVLRLGSIEKEARYLRSRLESIDYNNRMEEASKYLGRYYKSKENEPRYVFVYDICKVNCNPLSIEFYYGGDADITGTINIRSSYFPDDEFQEWIEISKEEFMINYFIVENSIKKHIK